MKHTNTKYRVLASLVFATFISNTIAPTLQYAFADSTQYYVDATGGSDTNDGLTPATAWQTLSHVNSQTLLQGDVVSLKCGESWAAELLTSVESGSLGLPITYNTYGTCDGSNNPIIDEILIVNADYVSINGLNVNNMITVGTSNDVQIQNTSVLGWSGHTLPCLNVTDSSNLSLSSNVFSTCGGITLTNVSSTVQNNTFSGMLNDALVLNSALSNTISNNVFINNEQSAIVFSENANIIQNTITNSCTLSSANCAAIRNNLTLPVGTVLNTTVSQNIILNTGTGVSTNNRGIFVKDASTVTISSNTVNNAEDAIHIVDAGNITVSNNSLLLSRKNSISVIQNSTGTVVGNTLTSNTLYQKNIDYPYIEMRDEVPGTGTASLLSANGNKFLTMYKPDTSYVRSVKFGGETVEYNRKKELFNFDSTATYFQSFGYKPYTFTGAYTTANLLSNPDFEADVSGWTPYAVSGTIPSTSQQVGGSYSGNSMLVTPQDVTPTYLGVTNDAILNITAGQVYEVKGYLRSTSTGNLSIRGYFHQSGDRSVVYSDRIAETYATNTGRTFQFYLYAGTTAADAQFSLESTNQNIALEVDEVSVRRKSTVVKNAGASEVYIFSNTGSSAYDQNCPGGSCAQYYDVNNAVMNWPVNIPGYSTVVGFYKGGSNVLNPPTVDVSTTNTSIALGNEADVTWSVDADAYPEIHAQYQTLYSGSISEPIGYNGTTYFTPPAGNSTFYVYGENDIGETIGFRDFSTTNVPPTAFIADFYGTEDDVQIVGTLSGSDPNPGDTLTFAVHTGPSFGVADVLLDGTTTYYLTPDFCGTDSFRFRAYDQFSNQSSPEFAYLHVTCTNDVPTAVNDSFTVTGAVTLFDAVANDTDPDTPYQAQSFYLTGFTQPSHGTVVINANQFEYTVDNGYIGSDSFTYVMEDQSGALSNTGTINISVTVPNTPPTGYPASYSTNEDTAFMGTVTGSDINPDTLTFTASVLPVNGTLVLLSNGSFTYTPNANYNGTDGFTYQVFDGSAYSTGDQIDFTVNSISDAPVAIDDNYSLLQDTSMTVPVMNNDTDVDSLSTDLSLTGYTNPTNGTLSINGTGLLYTPNIGYSGSDSFTYQIIDETSLTSNTATVTMTVLPSDTPPIADNLTFTLNEDAQLVQTLSGADPEGATLTYVIDTLPTSGTISSTATGVFTYTPNPDYNGSDSFTYHVSDGGFISNTATVNITVNPVNDAPISQSGSYAIAGNNYASSGNIFTGTLTVTDVDSSVFSFTTSLLPVHGAFSLDTVTGDYSYMPAYGYTGTDTLSYIVTDDGLLSSSTGVITFNISGINSAPFALSGSYMTNEDTTLNITLSGSDPDFDAITFVRDTNVATGTLTLGTNGNATYVPPSNYNGTVTFTFHTNDGLLSSVVQTVTIDVLPVNDAPVATSATYTMSGNTSSDSGHVYTGALSAVDIDNVAHTFTITSSPSHGTVAYVGSGVFTYVPDIDYTGNDSFTFTADDGFAVSNGTITFNMPVPGVPDSTPSNKDIGPGGGGGGGGSTSSSSSSSDTSGTSGAPTSGFNSAPNTYQGFMAADSLSAQLLFGRFTSSGVFLPVLLNPTYTGTLESMTPVDLSSTDETIISEISNMLMEIDFMEDPAVYIRQIVSTVIHDAEQSNDPSYVFDSAIEQIESLDLSYDRRLELTQEYALRILNFRKKMYEDIVYRDLQSNTSNSSQSSDEENSNITGGDGTDTDNTNLEDILNELDLGN